MSLRRVSAGAHPVTLDEVRFQCQIGDQTDWDVLLVRLIAAASEAVREDSGLVLRDETWELTVTDPVGPVVLPLIPVSGLVSVNGDEDVTGYALSIDGDCASVSGDWPPGDVTIRFKAGGDVPEGLRHAILMLIGEWFLQREAASADQRHAVPFAVESLIARHRRGWVKA